MDTYLQRFTLIVFDGKGRKGRVTLLNPLQKSAVEEKIERAIGIRKKDNDRGVGPSMSPPTGRNYPSAFKSFE